MSLFGLYQVISLRLNLSLLSLYQVYQFKDILEFVWFISGLSVQNEIKYVTVFEENHDFSFSVLPIFSLSHLYFSIINKETLLIELVLI